MAEGSAKEVEELKEFVDSLEDFKPAVPDELCQYALRRAGYECTDVRTLRLVALASQRFISSILDEAVNVHKRRRLAPAAQLRADGHNPRDKRIVLSTEELAEALREYGVNAKPAPYFTDTSKAPAPGQAQH